MKKPSMFERMLNSKTEAFIAALRGGNHEEAISIYNQHGLIAELAVPAIETAFQTACNNEHYDQAARMASAFEISRDNVRNAQERALERSFREHQCGNVDAVARSWKMAEADARVIAQRFYERSLQQGRFKDAMNVGKHFGFPAPDQAQLKAKVSGAYRKAIAEFRFADAQQCVCPELDILTDGKHERVLNLLLDAAALIMSRDPHRQWMPYLPGHPKFKCAPGNNCKADCCRKTDWNVPLSKREVETIKARTGIADQDFTTQIRGYHPFTYLPALKMVPESRGQKCMFLLADNRCQIHAFKPAACVKYPFTTFPFGRDSKGELDWFPWQQTSHYLSDLAKARKAVADLRNGNSEVYFFVLVGYEPKGCPGFTEESISIPEYLSLMTEQFELYLRTDGEFICGAQP